jgi:hypothetical protein
MRMRRVLIGVAAVAVIAVGAVGVDYGTSIYAEYRLSSNVRKAAHLGTDPFVAILAFPFIPQAVGGRYSELEIKANAVDHAVVGKATLEATMYSINLAYASWLIRPDAKLPVGRLESRIIIDSMHLGRYLGMSDLMVEAPPADGHPDRTRYRRPGRPRRQAGRRSACFHRQDAQPAAAVRGGADQRGRARLGRHHRRRHRGSKCHAGWV